MKAIIESFVIMNSFDNVGRENYQEALGEFNIYLTFINNVNTREELREMLKNQIYNQPYLLLI